MIDKIKTYLFLDRDIDELGWSDETIESICKTIVDTMVELELIDDMDIQVCAGEIDYLATANDECVYLPKSDKDAILNHLSK